MRIEKDRIIENDSETIITVACGGNSHWMCRRHFYCLTEHDTLRAYHDRLFQPIHAEAAANLVGDTSLGDNRTLSPLQPGRAPGPSDAGT